MTRVLMAAALAALMFAAGHAATPAAVTSDPPIDRANPASLNYVQIPSHGVLLNGVLFGAAGAGPHPTLLLLHGFPGNEQNLDLAQAVRRAGFNVLTLHYRGAWGSPGSFSFAHAIEDADAAMAFLRDPNTVRQFHIDTRRIFVAGHSMGGFMALSAMAHDGAVAGLVMISGWNIGADGAKLRDPKYRKAFFESELRDDVIPLAGTSADALMDEAQANARRWLFANYAGAAGKRPVLLIGADDGNMPDMHALGAILRRTAPVTEIHMATDHSYSDHRIALESAVVAWLEQQIGR